LNEGRNFISTSALITWAHIIGAIDDDEKKDLLKFNHQRNDIMHGHGNWWSAQSEFNDGVAKGVQFLEKNGFT
jgi:hypothetical protein